MEQNRHAPIHIGDQTYSYDANGNQTGWTSDKTGQRITILWDEENRIRSIYDDGAQHHYIYDASGERVIKGKRTGQRIFVNGESKAGSGQMGNYTVYVNPYIVLRSGGYTKHYYIEGQRIVSTLGGGWDNNGLGPLKAGEGKVDYPGREQKVFDGIVKNLKFLGADGQILTAGKSGKVPPGQVKGSGNVAEKFRYFYHPDHLGSTSYVTDASGEVFQHLEYTAWGETFVEEHSNTDRTPYLFNGKELDEETGLYYYGARYYDARTSVFQSVDPHAETYPAWNPYNYTFNNPLNYTDPDGKDGRARYQQGAGTKENPHVITVKANYYYNRNNLTQEEISGLNASVLNYNNLESSSGKSKDGTYTVMRFEISATGLDNDQAVRDAAAGATFVDANGETQFFGNIISGHQSQGDEFGDATSLDIRINRTNVSEAVDKGFSQADILEGTFNHEIGHNLGGEHGDPSPMAEKMTLFYRQEPNKIGGEGIPTVPSSSLTKKFAEILKSRIGTPNAGGQITYERGYTPPQN